MWTNDTQKHFVWLAISMATTRPWKPWKRPWEGTSKFKALKTLKTTLKGIQTTLKKISSKIHALHDAERSSSCRPHSFACRPRQAQAWKLWLKSCIFQKIIQKRQVWSTHASPEMPKGYKIYTFRNSTWKLIRDPNGTIFQHF